MAGFATCSPRFKRPGSEHLNPPVLGEGWSLASTSHRVGNRLSRLGSQHPSDALFVLGMSADPSIRPLAGGARSPDSSLARLVATGLPAP